MIPTEAEFWAFTRRVPIVSRETGVAPITPWATQRRLIAELLRGLKDDVRQYYVLKGGQVGCSTVMHLFTLWWLSVVSPGIQGVCVTDSDELREFFRDNLTLMIDALEGRRREDSEHSLRRNNRNMLAFHNASRLLFMTAGPRSGRRLGVGRGVAYVFGDEIALWPSASSLAYLRTRFSDRHPHRLLVLAGTARGRNWWYDLYMDAQSAADIRCIFLGWWLREDYRLERDTESFRRYWDNRLSRREQHWARELERRYHVTVTPEQWAWRRWYEAEKCGGDPRIADQEEPTLPEDAFEASGASFLGYALIARCRQGLKRAPRARAYRYEFGPTVDQSAVRATSRSLANLLVWEDAEPHVPYVVAAVPAHSTSPACATWAVSVWKASRDSLIQVAEYADGDCGLLTFTWVILHLYSSYNVSRASLILELAGTGMAVLQELKRAQQSGWGSSAHAAPTVKRLVGPLRQYLWRRPDVLGAGGALQWRSSGELRSHVLRRLKDQLECGAVQVRSDALVDELERMRQHDDQFVTEGRTIEEHRLMAAALAVECWAAQLRPLFRRVQGDSPARDVMGRVVGDFFAQLARQGPVRAVLPGGRL